MVPCYARPKRRRPYLFRFLLLNFEVDDFSSHRAGKFIQFFLTNMLHVDLEIASADPQHPEAGFFLSLFHFSSFPDKDFGCHDASFFGNLLIMRIDI
jgi:hypothetical protein